MFIAIIRGDVRSDSPRNLLQPGSPVRRTLKQIAAEYGTVAVVVYLTIFTVVLLGSWAAISFGWKPSSVGAGVGSFTAAYIATKITQPLRIAATLALTPIVARAWERIRPPKARTEVPPPAEADVTPPA